MALGIGAAASLFKDLKWKTEVLDYAREIEVHQVQFKSVISCVNGSLMDFEEPKRRTRVSEFQNALLFQKFFFSFTLSHATFQPPPLMYNLFNNSYSNTLLRTYTPVAPPQFSYSVRCTAFDGEVNYFVVFGGITRTLASNLIIYNMCCVMWSITNYCMVYKQRYLLVRILLVYIVGVSILLHFQIYLFFRFQFFNDHKSIEVVWAYMYKLTCTNLLQLSTSKRETTST